MFNLSQNINLVMVSSFTFLLQNTSIGACRFTANTEKWRRFCRMKENENIHSVKLPRGSGVTVNVSFVLEPHHQIVNAGA